MQQLIPTKRQAALFAFLTIMLAGIICPLFGCRNAAAEGAVLTMSEPPMQIRSQAVRINPEFGALTVPMLQAAFKGEVGDVKIRRIYVESDSPAVNTYYLYNGSTFIAATGVDPNIENFLAADIIVPKDTMFIPTIAVNLREDAQTANPSGTVSVRITKVTYEKPDGTEATLQSNLIGRSMYPMEAGAIYALRSKPTISASPLTTNGTTAAVVATFTYDIQVFGGTVTMPTPDLFRAALSNVEGTERHEASAISVSTIPGSDLGDGTWATVTITAMFTGNTIRKSGLYFATLEQVGWKIGQTTTLQNWDLQDAVTGVAQVNSNDVARTRIVGIHANADQTLTITAEIPAFSYALQYSSDLTNWSTGNPPDTTRTLMSVAADGMQTFEIRTPKPSDATKRFFRIAVTPW